MRLLHADVDTTVIALWLGHEQIQTTQIYLHADLAIKHKALDRTTPPNTKPGRYQPTASSSRSSTRSDYADHIDALPTPSHNSSTRVGITRKSA